MKEPLGPEMGRDVNAGMEGAVVWVVAQMLAVVVGAEAEAGARSDVEHSWKDLKGLSLLT